VFTNKNLKTALHDDLSMTIYNFTYSRDIINDMLNMPFMSSRKILWCWKM